MPRKRALMMVKLDPPAEREAEWNDWYAGHVAARLALPGWLSGRRFVRMDGIPRETAVAGEAKYLALYDLAGVDVLKSEAYDRLREQEATRGQDSFDVQVFKLPKFARGIYEQIYPEEGDYRPPPSRFVSVMGHEVPRNRQREFAAWYDTEHIPSLMVRPGYLTCRRFKLSRDISPIVSNGGTLPTYLTVYDIESERVFERGASQPAAPTPWTQWVRSWYTRKMSMVARRIYPKD